MNKITKFLMVVLAGVLILPGLKQSTVTVEASSFKDITRLAGLNREETAVETSKEVYKNSNAVVLSGFGGDIDALTGTLLASSLDAPLLITRSHRLSDITKKEILRLDSQFVYILGGENVISSQVEHELKLMNQKVIRVDGINRYETAAKVAEKVTINEDAHAFVVLGREVNPGDALADALAIGPVSGRTKSPILLVEKEKIPSATEKAIFDLGIKEITIIGGSSVVSQEVENTLSQLINKDVNRVAGNSREGTSLEIAREYFEDFDKTIIANGRKSADALVGGYLGAKINAPILLSNQKGINKEAITFLSDFSTSTYLLGGPVVISEKTFYQIVNLMDDLHGSSSKPENFNVEKALFNYLSKEASSKSDLIRKVKRDNFTEKEILNAIKNIGINWKYQALTYSEDILEILGLSEWGLDEHLDMTGFTPEEIKYAMTYVVVDWNTQALKNAQSLADYGNGFYSKEDLRFILELDGFKPNQIEYALKHVKI